MLARLALTAGTACVLVAACGGSSNEFTTQSPGSGAAAGLSATGGAGAGSGGSATSGAGGTNASGTGGIAASDAPVTVALDLCDKIFLCCSADELMNLSVLGQSKSSCELAVAAYLGLLLDKATPSIDAGRLVYDGTALSKCLDDYGGESCDMLRGLDDFDCPGLLVPEVAQGDACGLSAECIDGYCDGSDDPNNPVGECVPKKQNGADCADSAECVGGTCDVNTCTDTAQASLCSD
ncbi:MAG TPA: hypothetical protein VMI54_19780 [Polyangiaceae bacterium]|nr:hypothetical protein [Polyangiaceae bacterium]